MPPVDYIALAPELILLASICGVLIADLVLEDRWKRLMMPLSFAGVAATLAAVLYLSGGPVHKTLGGMFVVDPFAILFKVIFCLAALFVFAISHDYLKDDEIHHGEYYLLLLSSLLGMLTIASSRDLIAIFVALETISIPAFVLAGIRKNDLKSNEASLKFFLFGVLSTALMLYGMSLIYGVTGNTNLSEIAAALSQNPPLEGLATLAVFFVVVGFGFKVSAFPFQWWVPDTYEGSPVPIAAFLSVASKTAGFVGLIQIMFVAFIDLADVWRPFIALVSVFTMTFGNLVALQQKHIIRLLAYSSIGQAGYIILPLGLISPTESAINEQALVASAIYLLIYAFMETGAFACAIAYGKRGGGYMIEDYSGAWHRSPGLAFSMTVFLLSLAGMIPLAGFWAKFFVFRAALNAGAGWLAAAMAVNTVIALFYYVTVVRKMAFDPPADSSQIEVPSLLRISIALTAVVVLVVGLLPNVFASLAETSTLAL